MKGPGWNGRDFFPNEHVTILNRGENEIDLANSLLVPTDRPQENAANLRKIIELLIPQELTNQVNLLVYYAELYSGFKVPPKTEKTKKIFEELLIDSKEAQKSLKKAKFSEKSLKDALKILEEVLEEEAYRILGKCRFGDSSIFQKFLANDGESDKPLAWPEDAIKWSSPARLEFILYTAGLEYNLPKALRETLAFNYANELECDFSRKPSTFGCAAACEVRLGKNGQRGIPTESEMKSMIFLARDSSRKDDNGKGRLIFIAVHIEGDSEVDRLIIIKKLEEIGIIPEKVDKDKNHRDELDNLLTRNGAQQKIRVYAAGINPISITMGIKRNYGRSGVPEFDTVFFVQDDLFKLEEGYNNAGSPTWGMRFNPRALLSAVESEINNINKDHGSELIKIVHGDFQRPRLSLATPIGGAVGAVQDQALETEPPEARREIA